MPFKDDMDDEELPEDECDTCGLPLDDCECDTEDAGEPDFGSHHDIYRETNPAHF